MEDMKLKMNNIVKAAIAAPSSHNTQPWKLGMRENVIEVWGDEQRMLPKSDSDHRQFFISLGCAVQNILESAKGEGLVPDLKLFPEAGSPLLVAQISLSGSGEADTTVLERILKRHANRDPYLSDPVPRDIKEEIEKLGSEDIRIYLVEEEGVKTKIATVVKDATEAAFNDKGFTEELSHWIKPSLKKYKDGMPGYNIGIPWPFSFVVPLAIRYGKVAKQQRAMLEAPLAKTPTYFILATKGDDPLVWVRSGMLFEQAWLIACQAGLVMGPLAAPIQIGEFYKDVQAVLGTELRPQIFARLGYPTKFTQPSPRREAEDIII
jgi:hypothetical protein